MKVLVIGPAIYGLPFGLEGHEIQVVGIGQSLKHVQVPDLTVFTGGADVNPKLYGEAPLSGVPTDYYDKRDDVESDFYARIVNEGKAAIGICRGAQLLNVLNGGHLVQDVHGHTISHSVSGHIDGETFNHVLVTSTHHQMMVPPPKVGVLLGYSYVGYQYSSVVGLPLVKDVTGLDVTRSLNGKSVVAVAEPEIVHFPNSKTLCVQFHPERMIPSHKFKAGAALNAVSTVRYYSGYQMFLKAARMLGV